MPRIRKLEKAVQIQSVNLKKRDKAKQALSDPSKKRPKHKPRAPSAIENPISPGALVEPEEEPVAVDDGHPIRKKRRKRTPVDLKDGPSVAAERSFKTVTDCSSSRQVDVPARISRKTSSTGKCGFNSSQTPLSPTVDIRRDGATAHNTHHSRLKSMNPASSWTHDNRRNSDPKSYSQPTPFIGSQRPTDSTFLRSNISSNKKDDGYTYIEHLADIQDLHIRLKIARLMAISPTTPVKELYRLFIQSNGDLDSATKALIESPPALSSSRPFLASVAEQTPYIKQEAPDIKQEDPETCPAPGDAGMVIQYDDDIAVEVKISSSDLEFSEDDVMLEDQDDHDCGFTGTHPPVKSKTKGQRKSFTKRSAVKTVSKMLPLHKATPRPTCSNTAIPHRPTTRSSKATDLPHFDPPVSSYNPECLPTSLSLAMISTSHSPRQETSSEDGRFVLSDSESGIDPDAEYTCSEETNDTDESMEGMGEDEEGSVDDYSGESTQESSDEDASKYE